MPSVKVLAPSGVDGYELTRGSEAPQPAENCQQHCSKVGDQVIISAKTTREVEKGFMLEHIRNGVKPRGPCMPYEGDGSQCSCGSEVLQLATDCPQRSSKSYDQVIEASKSRRETEKKIVLENIKNGTKPCGSWLGCGVNENTYLSKSQKVLDCAEKDLKETSLATAFSTDAFEKSLCEERRLDVYLRRAVDSVAQAVFAHAEQLELEGMARKEQDLHDDSSSWTFPPPRDEDDNPPKADAGLAGIPFIEESALIFVATIAKIQLAASLTWLQQLTDLHRKCMAGTSEQVDPQLPDCDCGDAVQGMLHDCHKIFLRELNECREAQREDANLMDQDDWADFPEVSKLDRVFMKQQAMMVWNPARDTFDHRIVEEGGTLPYWWSLALAERTLHTLRFSNSIGKDVSEDCSPDMFLRGGRDDSDYRDVIVELKIALARASAQHFRALVAEHSLLWREVAMRECQQHGLLNGKRESDAAFEDRYAKLDSSIASSLEEAKTMMCSLNEQSMKNCIQVM